MTSPATVPGRTSPVAIRRVRALEKIATDIIMIPLSKLIESEDNVRRTNRRGGVAELAASIRSHGLLQSIVVREAGKGNHTGEPKIERGLVRAEDVKALKALRRKLAKPGDHESEDAFGGAVVMAKPRLPAKLVDELLAHKTLALRAEIAGKPDLALRLVVFTLAVQFLGSSSASCLSIAIDEVDVARSITRSETTAPAAYAEVAETWRDRLPANPEALWAFVSAANPTILLDRRQSLSP